MKEEQSTVNNYLTRLHCSFSNQPLSLLEIMDRALPPLPLFSAVSHWEDEVELCYDVATLSYEVGKEDIY